MRLTFRQASDVLGRTCNDGLTATRSVGVDYFQFITARPQ